MGDNKIVQVYLSSMLEILLQFFLIRFLSNKYSLNHKHCSEISECMVVAEDERPSQVVHFLNFF